MKTKMVVARSVWALTAAVWLMASALPSQAVISQKLSLKGYAGVEEAAGDPAENLDPVLNWLDQSGNGNHATQPTSAYRPIVTNNALNGLPVIYFDGQRFPSPPIRTNYLVSTFGTAVTQPFTVFLVGRYLGNNPATGNGASDYFLDGTTAGNRVIMATNPTGSLANETNFFMYAGSAEDPKAGIARADWTQYRVFEAYFDGASSALYLNGLLVDTGNPGANGIFALTIGNNFNLFEPLQGHIAEIQVWEGTPTATERNLIGEGLGSTWGLTTSYVPEPGAMLLLVGGFLLWRQTRRRG